MNRQLLKTSFLAALIVGCACSPASEPKNKSKKNSSSADNSVVDAFNPETQILISKLSHNPELMNIEYLKFFIGRAENESYASNSLRPHYYWYDGHHRLTYELEQTQQSPGQVTESQMTLHLNDDGPAFSALGALYGEPAKRFYDQNAHAAELYSFVPNTFLIFSSPPNTFNCSQAKIVYRGTPLSMPSSTEMDLAQTAMIGRSAGLEQEQLTSDSLPLLQARVKTQPLDAEAHFALAQSYAQQSQLHQAIGEYKVALALSGTNANVRDKAITALRKMRVIDDTYDPTFKRQLELVHHGQSLKASGQQKQTPPPLPAGAVNGSPPF